jgi:hypothetical protein
MDSSILTISFLVVEDAINVSVTLIITTRIGMNSV